MSAIVQESSVEVAHKVGVAMASRAADSQSPNLRKQSAL